MVKIFLVATVLMSCMSILQAETNFGAKYAGEYLSLGAGGRSLAMGGAGVAFATDVTAGYYNPAGLARMEFPQIAVLHDARFANIVSYNYGAVAWPIRKEETIALSVIELGIGNIIDNRAAFNRVDINHNGVLDDTEDRPDKYKELYSYFNAADWGIFLSYAKRIDDQLSIGGNVKGLIRSHGPASAFGIGFDLGALYKVSDKFSLGANVQDVTTTFISWSTGTKEFLLPTAKLGMAYQFQINDIHSIYPVVDIDVRFENRRASSTFHAGPVSFDPRFGMEYAFKNVATLRAGLNDVQNFTVGAGLKINKIALDYSFEKFNAIDQLGNTHRFSLMVSLDQPNLRRQ